MAEGIEDRRSKRLTEDEFRLAVSGLEVSSQTVEIAYGVLVEGRRQAEFARRLGLSKGAISQTVARVWIAHQRKLPAGFERVCAVLPRHQAYIVRRWEEATKRRMK